MTNTQETKEQEPYWLCCFMSGYECDPNGLPRFSANIALQVHMPMIIEKLESLGYHIKKSRTSDSFGPGNHASIDVDLYGFKSKKISHQILEDIANNHNLDVVGG